MSDNNIFPVISFQSAITAPICAAISGQTNIYAIANDTSVSVFKLMKNTPLFVIQDFDKRPSVMAINKVDDLLAIGFDSGQVRLYSIVGDNLKLIRAFAAHKTIVSSLTFTDNSLFLASGCIDGQVRFFDITNHQLLQEFSLAGSLTLQSGKQTVAVEDCYVTCLAFNKSSTLLFAGDKSGRVMIWKLTEMAFVAELIVSSHKIVYLQPHPVFKSLNVTDGTCFYNYSLEDYGMVFMSEKKNNLYSMFTPTKDEKVVIVRNSAADIYRGSELSKSYPTRLDDYLCCGQRATSTVPQLVAICCSGAGDVQVIAISCKTMPIFNGQEDNNEQTLAAPPKSASNQNRVPAQPARAVVPLPPVERIPARQYEPEVEGPTPSTPSGLVNRFMNRHVKRQTDLVEKVTQVVNLAAIADSKNPGPLIEQLSSVDSLDLFTTICQTVSIERSLDIRTSQQLVAICEQQLSKLDLSRQFSHGEADTMGYLLQLIGNVAHSNQQMIKDVTWAYNNRNPRAADFSVEERYEKVQALIQALNRCYQTVTFVEPNTRDTMIQLKLRQLASTLRQLGYH